MHMILPMLLTAAFVGAAVVYVQPYIAAIVPASLTGNKWLAVLVVGGLTLISLFIAAFALRALKLPRVV
jgi:hypothetical protein